LDALECFDVVEDCLDALEFFDVVEDCLEFEECWDLELRKVLAVSVAETPTVAGPEALDLDPAAESLRSEKCLLRRVLLRSSS